jgi:hypothetical protein
VKGESSSSFSVVVMPRNLALVVNSCQLSSIAVIVGGMEPDDELLTREQAAELLDVSVSTIDRWFPPGNDVRHETWPQGRGEGRRPHVRLRRAPLMKLREELGR